MATAAAASAAPRCEFEVILEDFKTKAQLSPRELEEFKFADLAGLQHTIKTIQLEQEAKRRMRHMRRLEPFLQTMAQYGQVVDVFVNTSETLAFIWVSRSWTVFLLSLADTKRSQGPMKWLLMVGLGSLSNGILQPDSPMKILLWLLIARHRWLQITVRPWIVYLTRIKQSGRNYRSWKHINNFFRIGRI